MADERSARRGWFGRGRTRALLSVGLLLGMGAVATSAYWTEEVSIAGTTVQSGALHIDLDGRDKVRNETFPLTFDLSNLAANESRSRTLQVKNNSVGPVALSYQFKTTATGTLGAQLRLTVLRAGATGPAGTCTGTSIGVSSVPFDNVARPGTALVLAPGASDTMCVAVSRTNAALAGGLSSNLTFQFDATQVP